MALGGGIFTSQNKVLPGSYINFVSAAKASAQLSDRGIVTMPFELDWGAEGTVIEVTQESLIKNSLQMFGLSYTDAALADVRDIMLHATKLYAYRLNGGGVKASSSFATAKCSGKKGNDLKVVVAANADDAAKWDVALYLETKLVDKQTVATAAGLKDNDFVAWKTGATLTATAGTNLTGGTNGSVTGDSHSAYLAAMEAYSFNAIGCKSEDAVVKAMYAAWTKRMRDEVGSKFQCVLYSYAADYEGVISVKNSPAAVPWVVGAEGGCAVNKTCMNMTYDGEATVTANYTQVQLTDAIAAGELTLHKVGDDIRVLMDINSLTTTTTDKNSMFQSNQSIRVMDQIANDIAVVFNSKYLGKIQNNAAGRVSLWTDIVKHHTDLLKIGAIEDFKDADVVVTAGTQKEGVVVQDAVTIVNAMGKLYMTVTVA